MYLASLEIRNLRCFAEAKLEFPAGPGWNVILGGNGQGKSTLLQAAALAMAGPHVGEDLLNRHERVRMVRKGKPQAQILAHLVKSPEDHKVYVANFPSDEYPVDLKIAISGYYEGQIQLDMGRSEITALERGPYDPETHWFSAGYGPYRWVQRSDEPIPNAGKGIRYLTLFQERASLAGGERWLTDMCARPINDSTADAELLETRLRQVIELINKLLPGNIQIESVTTKGVTFRRDNDVDVRLDDLSEGYRGFLGFILDILRHLLDAGQRAGKQEELWLDTSGVVLIDEADAHLHPEWQRALGGMLCAVFPNIQFIVTSHSAFIAQAAQPGGIFVLHSGPDGTVQVTREQGAVSGWTVDQILLSPLFGLHSTRGPEIERLINRRQVLLGRSSRTSLEDEELRGLTENLRKQMSAPGDSLEERDLNQKMMDYVRTRIGDMA